MAITVTHTTVATGTDAGNGEIHKAEWNEAHTISGLGTGVETFLTTPSSANLAALLTDETGTGTVLFSSQIDNTAYASSWNASTKAPTQDAVYDVIEAYAPPVTSVTTRWYAPYGTASGNDGAILSNTGRIYFKLMHLKRAMTVTDLGCRVSTAAAAGKVLQLAIYACHATTGMPTGSALASTGNIAADSAAAVSADISGADVLLPAGRYWGAINSDGQPAIRTYTASIVAEEVIGNTTLANVTGAFVGAPLVFYFDQTFGTWPDMTSNTCTAELSNRGGVIFLKAV